MRKQQQRRESERERASLSLFRFSSWFGRPLLRVSDPFPNIADSFRIRERERKHERNGSRDGKMEQEKKLVCRGKRREWNTAIAQERREKLPFPACLLCPLPPNGFLRKGKKLTWRIHSIPRSRPAEEASQTRSQRTKKRNAFPL